ncbi:MAG: hypothetical protein O2877_00160 [bacterium]|nr:hypothetical protein [bacterium]
MRNILAASFFFGVLIPSAIYYIREVRPLQQEIELSMAPSGNGQLAGGNRLPAGIEPETSEESTPTTPPASTPAPTPAPAPIADTSCDQREVIAIAEAMGNLEIGISFEGAEITVGCISNSQTVKHTSTMLPTEELCAGKVQEALGSVSAYIEKSDGGFDAICVRNGEILDATPYTFNESFPEAVFDCPAQIAATVADADAARDAAVTAARAKERSRPVTVAIPPSCFTELMPGPPDADGCYNLRCPEFQVFRKYTYAAGVGYRPCGS